MAAGKGKPLIYVVEPVYPEMKWLNTAWQCDETPPYKSLGQRVAAVAAHHHATT